MNYAARWRLAVATKQPYPNPSDTGGALTAEGGFAMSPEDVRTALQNASRAAWLALGIGVLGGLVGGFVVGRSSK